VGAKVVVSRGRTAAIFAGVAIAAMAWMQAMDGDISLMHGETEHTSTKQTIRHATAELDDQTNWIDTSDEARPVSPSSFDYALAVCNIVDATNLPAQECEVLGWDTSIHVLIDMDLYNARRFCHRATEQIRLLGLIFDPEWKLNIHSVQNDKRTIAICNLPTSSM
jgi:hypothetical protein